VGHVTADPALDRIGFVPDLTVRADPIPWPNGLAPVPRSYAAAPDAPLPPADALVVTWTAAEAEALADVLTPGVRRTAWLPYRCGWDDYQPHLTGRSPAAQAGCLFHYQLVSIGDLSVVAAKSELHLATDDDTAPVVQLWGQIVAETKPRLVLTTGTAGGIGSDTVLGDVAVAAAAQFNCQRAFKDKPWAHSRYQSVLPPASQHLGLFEQLAAVNAGRLKPVATRPPKVWTAVDVETIDFFGFDDSDDSYGVRADDPAARTEEMDDATLGLACSTMQDPPAWLSVRNASDPQVPSSVGTLEQQSRWASGIYQRYGYWTSVGSAIACWALIADLT
jgi:hypothetical protein